MEQFITCKKDVLVATDVASKGLDFPNIQHIINYDMPDDIENYGKLLLTYTEKAQWPNRLERWTRSKGT